MRSIQPPVQANDLSVEQDEAAYVASYSGTLDAVVARRVQYVQARIRAGSAILDFGAGFGYVARGLAAHGYRVAVLEKSPNAVAGMQRAGMRVVDSLDMMQGERFDAITLWHVLEHIDEPLRVLQSLRRFLKPGGSFLIAVPNAGGLFARASFEHWIWTLPWHLHYFTRRSLRRILERVPADVRDIEDGTGDVAALECTVGETLLRRPSRLTSREYAHGTADRVEREPLSRRAAMLALRPASILLQRAARAAGFGEELVAHAAVPDDSR